jgi:hypothetical protein
MPIAFIKWDVENLEMNSQMKNLTTTTRNVITYN